MSFRANAEQQLTLGDSALQLTERERRALEGSWAKVFGDEVFPAIDESRFSVLYSDKASRPNTPVNVIVGALVIKELYGYTDDELVEALMFDVRLQYALHTTSFEEQPLSDKTLSRFRRRCYDHERETGEDLWRDCVKGLAEKTAEIMGIDGRVRRMDSMMIESNIRTLSRSEIVYECLANACRRLKRALGDRTPEGFAAYADRDNFNRVFYHDRDKTLEERLSKVFADAEALVEGHAADLAGTEELALLLRCLVEQTVVEDGVRRLRDRGDGMRGSSMLQSPYDADATYRKKAGRDHRGFVANLEESCGEAGTVVTNYDYRPNNHSDSAFLKEFVDEAAGARGTGTTCDGDSRGDDSGDDDCGGEDSGDGDSRGDDGPGSAAGARDTLVTDGGYDGGDNVAYAEARGVELVTTALIGKEPIDCLADFEWSEDGTELMGCAAGHAPIRCHFTESTGQCQLVFDARHCEGCPFRDQCKPKVKNGRARRTTSRRTPGSGTAPRRCPRCSGGATTSGACPGAWCGASCSSAPRSQPSTSGSCSGSGGEPATTPTTSCSRGRCRAGWRPGTEAPTSGNAPD